MGIGSEVSFRPSHLFGRGGLPRGILIANYTERPEHDEEQV